LGKPELSGLHPVQNEGKKRKDTKRGDRMVSRIEFNFSLAFSEPRIALFSFPYSGIY
jgi:hypothetical protein